MGKPSLLALLDYLDLLADVRPDKFERAAVRWHGKLVGETPLLTLALRKLLRRVRPTLLPRVS
jgi:hypothetical protein